MVDLLLVLFGILVNLLRNMPNLIIMYMLVSNFMILLNIFILILQHLFHLFIPCYLLMVTSHVSLLDSQYIQITIYHILDLIIMYILVPNFIIILNILILILQHLFHLCILHYLLMVTLQVIYHHLTVSTLLMLLIFPPSLR